MTAMIILNERTCVTVDPVTYRYIGVGMMINSDTVPLVGDIVWHDRRCWRVMERAFNYPEPGSISARNNAGPMIDLIVEESLGLFRDEAELEEVEND